MKKYVKYVNKKTVGLFLIVVVVGLTAFGLIDPSTLQALIDILI